MLSSLRLSSIRAVNSGSIRFVSSTVPKSNAKLSVGDSNDTSSKTNIDDMKSKTSWNESYASGSSIQVNLNENLNKITENISSSDPPIYVSPNLHRHFTMGDTYNPFDFSMNRFDMEKKMKSTKKLSDPFEKSGIDPKNLYLMPEILSKFLTSTGQILPRQVTGCNAKNQKRLSMAIEYARSLGLLSSQHRHARYMPTRNL
ncbi:ribosomal protein S18 [Candida albicans P57072]|uniref:Small ribosomal subunit protein bS18m n=1 Tax=Candida albicans (strain WO-1) TaxID=294748 RepID=C4YEK0_CANAW|nr:hypothetical protein CAWG_00957 [Candida albicans WO-1]KGQ91702.1 ribosomal protein S18 [Candida albicans P94015]KGR03645.1 ribosomal protein S18 [Candida albicans GC75]KGR15566.1 ribosomal protein S18 [Candida albicans P57072]KGU14776.1 ribosomal protein S18 [Candida albicans P87]KGU33812.1 ribosomal protein S18 [Candida albicans P34048]KGU36023.1 ribosomal protein S18 [Candida albicans P75063]KGU37645.1 ribosomal protein S18 [Candida albicans P57055]KHC40475.1 ribosomal protein S18 [Ca